MSENGQAAHVETSSGRGSPWKGRTHCQYGHEFSPENTLHRSDSTPGARRCLECKRRRYREYYDRRGAALRAQTRRDRKSQ
jgi:hypothetical protein